MVLALQDGLWRYDRADQKQASPATRFKTFVHRSIQNFLAPFRFVLGDWPGTNPEEAMRL
jgi:hypothetical protein